MEQDNESPGTHVTTNLSTDIHIAQCIAGLRIEVSTGMRHSRGSILAMVQRLYGVKSRTKKGALKELEQLYYQRTGRRYGQS
jgi:hypothetical protein